MSNQNPPLPRCQPCGLELHTAEAVRAHLAHDPYILTRQLEASAEIVPQPDYWRCQDCGCLWRDNHDGSISLGSPKQKSCARCEGYTIEVCEPLWLPRTLGPEEFIELALMGQTKDLGLRLGDGAAERMLEHAKKLAQTQAAAALSPDDVLDLYVPGRLRCPKCAFELTKATIFVQSGEIGASKSEVYQQSEPCPNDGVAMLRVLWREEANRNQEYAVRLIDEIIEATGTKSLPEAFEAIRIARAAALGDDEEVPASTTLTECWERFSEEEKHAQVEVGPARRAFWAGAQSMVGVVSTAMEHEDDLDAWQKLEGAYEEIGKACEELKI